MKPHKHAKLIKAWADGAEIEYTQIGDIQQQWMPIFEGWSWDNKLVDKYRIKPQPKPDVVQIWNANPNEAPNYRLTGKYNLKLTFDGETGELKSAEVI